MDHIVNLINKTDNKNIINGDILSILFGFYIQDICINIDYKVEIGIIQTVCTNGATTKFIKKHLPLINIVCTSIDIFNINCELEKFDICIYFESNGNGTILFNLKFIKFLETNNNNKYILKLLLLNKLINENNNEITDMFIENILLIFKVNKLIKMYIELPCKTTIFKIDSSLFKTFDFDKKCSHPFGFQDKIDSILNKNASYPINFVNNTKLTNYKCSNARAFVIPNINEDTVRIYVEA